MPPITSRGGIQARRGAPRPRGNLNKHGPTPSSSSPAAGATAAANTQKSFTSCISIPVQGARSLSKAPREPPPGIGPELSKPAAGARRAPRKSKTDAMAALASRDDDEDTADDERGMDGIAALYGPDADPIPVDTRLDMKSVKTCPPRDDGPRVRRRPFGLEDCPTYRPSPTEFRDPMAYIQKIAPEAHEYGICKIVPPEGWHMPFVTDTEKFKFTTRVQRLNSIEASSRAKVNFLEQLYRYHQQAGNTRMTVPSINNKAMDLWLLRKEVEAMGGFEAVNKARKWADLGRLLGYGGVPGLSTQIKNAYMRVILPFEKFHRHVINSPALANVSTVHRNPALHTHAPRPSLASAPSAAGASETTLADEDDAMSGLSDLEEPAAETMEKRARRTTSRFLFDFSTGLVGAEVDQASGMKPVSPSTPSVKTAASKAAANEEDDYSQACEICHKNDRGEEMLLCDGCDCGFHLFCLDPPLSTVPRGKWYCHTCLFGTGGDFGFDEGQEHTLSSFQARDAEFRKLWFTSHPPKRAGGAPDPVAYKFGSVVVGEDDVEREFWRLVQSQNDTVEIEYGADVHSTTHGSASPTLETHPLDPYSKDPWNLNNIPILPESLLRYIKSDISGMTVPWTYVGMVFSTFCWHNEDHYTYSINFMHWGETKTWYGIPGEDAEKFEEAIRHEAPDLFEAQPDLLFQLVTLMNPARLRKAGVRVYACNQRAGEFVITFPKAYHAGFNHGLNFNEAVNFALPDWLKYGHQCIQRYREHRKLPVFSHDELLITITQQSQSIETSLWLKDSLKEMMERERMNRIKGRALGLRNHLEEEDRPEDQYQCAVCKVFCYLSQITCGCTNHVVCAEHADQLCSCTNTDQRALRLRFSDAELEAIYSQVEQRAIQPISWQNRLEALLSLSARPSLRQLRALVADGERINYALRELPTITKFVARANQWVDAANAFLVRKPPRGRGADERPAQTLADLRRLLQEVETLGFDAPEIANLRASAAAAEDIQERARELLSEKDRQAPSFLKSCESLLADAATLNVTIEEIAEVEKITGAREVLRAMEVEVEKNAMTLNEVSSLLTRARLYGIPQDDSRVRTLQQRQRNGQNWDERATHVLAQPYKTIEELQEFMELDKGILINPVTYDNIRRSLQQAREYEDRVREWMAMKPGTERPAPSEVLKLVNLVEKEYSIASIKDIKRLADFAADLESRCDQRSDLEDIFDVMHKRVDYAKQHLRMFHVRWLEHLPRHSTAPSVDHGKAIYADVMAATRPDDDLPPNDEFITCICDEPVRPPAPGALSDAVQCDHCFARFHGKCARSGGSCPFCDEHHWDGTIIRHRERHFFFYYVPTMLSYAPAITRHYSEDWRNVETIVHRIDRLITQIGQFLAYSKQAGNHRRDYIEQVRHYMRKLYKIPFTVSPSQNDNFGLELAHLHRALASLPSNQRAKKRRRPKFTFGQDVDPDWHDGTRCICRGRTTYLLGMPTVRCEQCTKLYHSGCVFYPPDRPQAPGYIEYTCPLCCLRKNRPYQYAELRNPNQQQCVDTTRMLDNFSKDIIYKTLPEPYTHTLFVELIRFVPGQPDIIMNCQGPPATAPPGANGARPRIPLPTPAPPAAPPSAPPPPIPPPPWQQGGPWIPAPVATPPAPPPAPPRVLTGPPITPPMVQQLPPPPPPKRKHEDGPSEPGYSPSHAPKRRNTADVDEPPPPPVPRQTPTLSPSLAMIMSPDPAHTSPRAAYIPNGHVLTSPHTPHGPHPSPRTVHASPGHPVHTSPGHPAHASPGRPTLSSPVHITHASPTHITLASPAHARHPSPHGSHTSPRSVQAPAPHATHPLSSTNGHAHSSPPVPSSAPPPFGR
ncbi:PLU-1-like protein-domain-containing protein [Vararia minispora EC-137]|uniref:PLU-1-like protein-domain-containing protein n=1 Tax=Vararia minispora EC-137 TaxID=1314806 RepID=A0ACB8QKL7_9AGAM|nr:PLU-1-like protein-domain-containing protein [Vararia minispora EC-137]